MPPSLEADKEEEETMEGEEGFLYLEGGAQPRLDHALAHCPVHARAQLVTHCLCSRQR